MHLHTSLSSPYSCSSTSGVFLSTWHWTKSVFYPLSEYHFKLNYCLLYYTVWYTKRPVKNLHMGLSIWFWLWTMLVAFYYLLLKWVLLNMAQNKNQIMKWHLTFWNVTKKKKKNNTYNVQKWIVKEKYCIYLVKKFCCTKGNNQTMILPLKP